MRRRVELLTAISLMIAIGAAAMLLGDTVVLRNSETATDASVEVKIYDQNPQHLWNRLHSALFVRTRSDGRVFGRDELDPLLWDQTKFLLSGPSYQRATKLLDEFLSTNGERLITDPLKRAMLQRDLWAVFDWCPRIDLGKKELMPRLARVIQRLELSPDQIRGLPDTYGTAVASKSFL